MRAQRVLLGVSGGIAAYKAAELVRRLRAAGHEVQCALTRAAGAFVTPLSLEILSGRPVHREEYLDANGSGRELHIEAAAWADVLLVAPATAHQLAKLAHGLADDFLSTTALAFEGPVVVAPAMHTLMWRHPAVAANVAELERRGVTVLGPATGPLASGEEGVGRMVEPAEIVERIAELAARGELAGRRVLVSAGPTREPADPVRFLSNRSSGRMGFALAAAASAAGAETVLVAGPVALPTPRGVERVDVTTADEMRDAIYARARECALVVMAAAVADFRPRAVAAEKIKKAGGWRTIELEPTPDVLAGLAAVAPSALRVGFAAETERLEEEAKRKLVDKELDFIVANDVSRTDVGFEVAENEVTVYARTGEPVHLGRQSKEQLARRLMTLFAEALARLEPDAAAVDS